MSSTASWSARHCGRTSTRQRPAPGWSTFEPPSSRSSSPSLRSLSFGAVAGPVGAERTIRITNVSTRRIPVSVGVSAIAPKGVEIEVDPQRFRLRPGGSAAVVVRANTTSLSSEAGAATGELVLRGSDTPEVHVPWTVAVPPAVDLVSRSG